MLQDGYYIVHDFLSKDEHSHLLDVSRTVYEDAQFNKKNGADDPSYAWDDNGQLNKIESACLFHPAFKNLASNPILVQTAKKLLNTSESLDCYISKFFPMQPHTGTSTFMHQDNFYFNGDNKKILSCAVYLTDTNKQNGCLRLAKGSHTKGILKHEVSSDVNKYIKWIDNKELECYDIMDLEFRGPYAVFFDINMVHGCYPNKSDDFRYSLAWEYIESSNTDVVDWYEDRIKLY